jgi:muconolactone delta-isomerase
LRAWELYQKGSVRELYFVKDDNLAVLILEAKNKEEVEKILQTLPLVKQKLIAFDVFPLIPYNGFERLFE